MLKPKKCPVCNANAVIMQTFDGICGDTLMFYVACEPCAVRTYSHLTKNKAVEAWNAEKEIIPSGGVFK